MKLGKKYYYVNQEALSVEVNVLLSHSIESHSKYGICVFKVGEEEYYKVEDVLVFDTKGQAEKRLGEVRNIIIKANAVGKELNEKLRLARENVIGKPEYAEIEV